MGHLQTLLGTVAAVAIAAGAVTSANAATILGLGCSVVGATACGAQTGTDVGGDIFSIDTTTGVATRFLDLNRGELSTQPAFSPNALGYNGAAYRLSFSPSGGSVNLFKNDTQQVVNPAIGSTSSAAGDVYGNTYYYLLSTGVFRSVDLTTNARSGNIADFFAGSQTLGDIAVSPDGTKMYVSYGSSAFGVYDFASNTFANITNAPGRRYAGLAFGEDGVLYGFTGGNATPTTPGSSVLYAINTGTGQAIGTGKAIKLGSTTGVQLGLTDGARAVPLPGALPLMLGALAGVGLIARRRNRTAA